MNARGILVATLTFLAVTVLLNLGDFAHPQPIGAFPLLARTLVGTFIFALVYTGALSLFRTKAR